MAEMTASEAIQTTIHVLDLSFAQRQQISALIEQQTAKIKQLEQTILMQDAQIMSKDRLLDAYRGRDNG